MSSNGRVNLKRLTYRVIRKSSAQIHRASPSNHWSFRGAERVSSK